VYEEPVDPDRYQQHIDEFVTKIPATFRHGKIIATPVGEERFHHYAEFEFDDMESFQQVANSPEFAATGRTPPRWDPLGPGGRDRGVTEPERPTRAPPTSSVSDRSCTRRRRRGRRSRSTAPTS
jgi:hypothetical protein